MTKEHGQLWEAEKRAVRQLRDGLGRPVDRAIVEMVAALRMVGVHTVMSCGGHVDREIGPSVSVASPRAEKHRRQAHEAEKPGDPTKALRAWRMVERYNAAELRHLVANAIAASGRCRGDRRTAAAIGPAP
jgi:hypothetical protein